MKSLSLVMLVVLAGCGAGIPREGDACTGDLVCLNPGSALFCEDKSAAGQGVFREYPCNGPNGCTSNTLTVICDVKGAIAGDRCPEVKDGKGFCRSADQRLVCKSDAWVAQACPGCREESGNIACN